MKRKEAVFLKMKASSGCLHSQVELGRAFLFGEGFSQSFKDAEFWLRRSHEEGSLEGAYQLAMFLKRSIDDEKKNNEAFQILYHAASLGHVKSQRRLARCFLNGSGTEENQAEAAWWFFVSGLLGDRDSRFMLGRMFELGQGVNPDSDESVYWYELAAENGDIDAQFLLAKILFNKGFIEDSERWFKSARRAGDKEAVKELKKIKEIKESEIDENYKY
ncbi:hypothetical protein CL645_04625 [bacterium]|nr:hypothetical protein [bacterium]|tara:strand:- start:13456 stop:14109 length:654 start_codon:yes stop_codon:yes gene_type:complete